MNIILPPPPPQSHQTTEYSESNVVRDAVGQPSAAARKELNLQ
jgi:hypothetical protein